ncbi:hypothetical protein ACIBL5_12670 [Streptomyces sp. NPDC050516]|uniref:hypothetical protein n=1 Tax=Streptomyces sp. NPDC050516 TaxID=3365621 RepID=UPI0037A4A68D
MNVSTEQPLLGRKLNAGHVVAIGWVLCAAALAERVPRFVSGHRYLLCHASSALDHLTLTALALVMAAGMAALAGAIMIQAKDSYRSALPVVWLVVVVALLVAADGVDAHGEELAAKLSATPFTEGACDYTPQDYIATPGWFFW